VIRWLADRIGLGLLIPVVLIAAWLASNGENVAAGVLAAGGIALVVYVIGTHGD
jgi:hypothetical protein